MSSVADGMVLSVLAPVANIVTLSVACTAIVRIVADDS